MQFIFKITYAPWPTSPYHDNFYDEYISGHPYEHHYGFLRDKSPWNMSPVARLSEAEQISRNFLKVHVHLDLQRVLEYEVRPEVSLTTFWSQIGGALNLWTGITVVVVIEVLELVYRVLMDCRRPNATESSTPHTRDQTPSPALTDSNVHRPEMPDGNVCNAFEFWLVYLLWSFQTRIWRWSKQKRKYIKLGAGISLSFLCLHKTL